MSQSDTIERAAIASLMQRLGIVDCWLEDDEAIWVASDDLALVLKLDMQSRCPTCGQHVSGSERWHLATQAALARRLFRRGYR